MLCFIPCFTWIAFSSRQARSTKSSINSFGNSFINSSSSRPAVGVIHRNRLHSGIVQVAAEVQASPFWGETMSIAHLVLAAKIAENIVGDLPTRSSLLCKAGISAGPKVCGRHGSEHKLDELDLHSSCGGRYRCTWHSNQTGPSK